MSPLATLRLANGLTVRELAADLELSHNAISMFELGRQRLAPDKLKLYAKAVGKRAREIEDKFLQAAFTYHARRVRELRDALKGRGAPPKRGRKIGTL